MGEQTILCIVETGSLLCFDKMAEDIDPAWAAKFVQYGCKTVTEALKHGGITNRWIAWVIQQKSVPLNCQKNWKEIMRPLFQKHQDDIMSGKFSSTMMADWRMMTKICIVGAPTANSSVSYLLINILLPLKNTLATHLFLDLSNETPLYLDVNLFSTSLL